MVPVAQPAERHTVDVDVVGSNPIRHPGSALFEGALSLML